MEAVFDTHDQVELTRFGTEGDLHERQREMTHTLQ